jgi:DNA-binding NtrC family response regulator
VTLKERKREFEAQCIREYLVEAGGSRTKAAELAGENRTAFVRKMAQYGIAEPMVPRGRPRRGNAEWQALGN